MIRIGDRVVPYFDMKKVGVVVSIESQAKNQMLTTGGTTSAVQFAIVKLDSSETYKIRVEDLLKADI